MSKIIDENGFWLVENNPISKEGVFPYLGKTISPELEPNKIYNVYRPFEELSNVETVKSFNAVPFINNHEMIGDGFTPYDERTADGVLVNVRAENGMLIGDLKIFSEDMKSKIQNGKKELSLGYKCDYQLSRGVFNGKPYDAIQTNLRGNHIALVDHGRMGSDVRVYDHYTFDTLDIEIINNTQKEEERKMLKEKEKKECADEKVDKRKLIDEIGGILKDKIDEELWRTVIGKVEKVAYNDSEKSANDEEEKEIKEEKAEKEEVKEETEEKEVKDNFIDEPKFIKHIDKLVGENKISSEIGEALKKSVASFTYKRASDEDAEKEDKKVNDKCKDAEEEKEDKKTASDSDDTFKVFAKRMAKTNEIAAALAPHIGTFDHAEMTPEEVSKYGCNKLGMDFNSDIEAMAKIEGFIAANKAKKSSVCDAKDTAKVDRMETYLAKGK